MPYQCSEVTSCAECREEQLCVREDLQLSPLYHCVNLSAPCTDKPDCACMGEAVCPGNAFYCADETEGVSCYFPDVLRAKMSPCPGAE